MKIPSLYCPIENIGVKHDLLRCRSLMFNFQANVYQKLALQVLAMTKAAHNFSIKIFPLLERVTN